VGHKAPKCYRFISVIWIKSAATVHYLRTAEWRQNFHNMRPLSRNSPRMCCRNSGLDGGSQNSALRTHVGRRARPMQLPSPEAPLMASRSWSSAIS